MLIVIKILAFLFAIFILVLVHEFGHFWVARRCGIKILKFSIGFGKALFTWYGKDGTQYILAAVPLGGYVKMLDTRETEVSAHERKFAFDYRPIWQRFLVVLTGPVVNLLFAFLVFWLLFVIGVTTPKPVIGKITPNSIASQAGLSRDMEIVAVDGKNVTDWQKVVLAVFSKIGDRGNLIVKTAAGSAASHNHFLDIDNWKLDSFQPDPLLALGITPYHPIAPAVIGKVMPKSPAAIFGLLPNDRVISVNNQRVTDWEELIEQIKKYPQQQIALLISRDGKFLPLTMTTDWKFDAGWKKIGYLGVGSLPIKWSKENLLEQRYLPLQAIVPALSQTWLLIDFNGTALVKLVTGKISFHVLGGPITIFQSAAAALNAGIVVYFGFLAILSIMLAFVNLLPIPGLDGGHILFLGIEALLRRPISVRTQVLVFRLGLILLILIMVQATINDLMRIF